MRMGRLPPRLFMKNRKVEMVMDLRTENCRQNANSIENSLIGNTAFRLHKMLPKKFVPAWI
jgi:hypothetical protein